MKRERCCPRGSQQQEGMALLIALVVLVVVSLLGTTAMRSALFQSRVSVNAQGAQMLFQGAESGIEGVFKYIVDEQIGMGIPVTDPANPFYQIVNGNTEFRVCLAADGARVVDNNAQLAVNGDDFDITYDDCDPFPNMPVRVSTVMVPPPPGTPNNMDRAGTSMGTNAGVAFSTGIVYSRAFAEVPGLGMQTSHVQLWGVNRLTETDK